ncbi:MAG: inactive transglutaminase family protein [Desulfuromonadaceae bacterium]
MTRCIFYTIIAVLLIGGISITAMRHASTGIPLLPEDQTEVWLIEARVSFTAEGRAVEASLDIPDEVPGFQIVNEQSASPGYGFSILDLDANRRGVWSTRSATGLQTLYYKVQVAPSQDTPSAAATSFSAVPQVFWDDAREVAARQVLAEAYKSSSSPLSMCRELIKLVNNPADSQNVSLLRSEISPVLLLEKLLNFAGIPNRIVKGLYLEENRRNLELESMIQIYTPERWVTFDPSSAAQGLPQDFFIWDQDGASLLDVSGARNSGVSFAITSQQVSTAQLALDSMDSGYFSFFDMHKLPVEEQNMLKVMLLLPMGALVVVFMSVLVGVRTSGTFMPILIALSFLQTSLVPGLLSFVAMVAFGLLLRGYLSYFNLLLVARISTIVVLVLLIIVFSSLFGYQIGINTHMGITFFPVIIVAWTIERMSILWEDEGPREVLIQGIGSLVVAVGAFMLMNWPLAAHLSFNFPEVNFIVLALIMLLGNYTGYKVSEMRRFRALRLKLRF